MLQANTIQRHTTVEQAMLWILTQPYPTITKPNKIEHTAAMRR